MTTESQFDPTSPPTTEAIRTQIGASARLWETLVGRAEAMGAQSAFAWGGPKSGWELKLTRAGKPFATLSPRAGRFTALVILGRAQVEEVPDLPLHGHVRAIFEAARPYPDGRWLFIPVESDEDAGDIVALLETKLPPTIRARLAAAR